MAPTELKCTECGGTVAVPEGSTARVIKCPECGTDLDVPGAAPDEGDEVAQVDVACWGCGRVFKIPADKGQDVVSCPSCGSWIKAGQPQRSLLYHQVPMPFQFPTSILRFLRFLAGLSLIGGFAAAVWIAISYATKVSEATGERVIDPSGIVATFAALVAAFVGTVVLMALYWILKNVTAIHYNTSRQRRTPPE